MKFRKIQRTNNFITLNHTKPHFSRSGSRMGFSFPFRKACFRLGGSLEPNLQGRPLADFDRKDLNLSIC